MVSPQQERQIVSMSRRWREAPAIGAASPSRPAAPAAVGQRFLLPPPATTTACAPARRLTPPPLQRETPPQRPRFTNVRGASAWWRNLHRSSASAVLLRTAQEPNGDRAQPIPCRAAIVHQHGIEEESSAFIRSRWRRCGHPGKSSARTMKLRQPVRRSPMPPPQRSARRQGGRPPRDRRRARQDTGIPDPSPARTRNTCRLLRNLPAIQAPYQREGRTPAVR